MFPSPRDSTFWRYISQVFIGFFFCAAAYYKLTDSFFGMSDVPLKVVFDYWIKQGYPIGFYQSFMQMAMPYLVYLSGVVIFLQGLFGLLMLYNIGKRTASALLFLVQINIFFATFHHTGFNVFVGLSLWIALYYFFQKSIDTHRWIWTVLTFLLVGIECLRLWIRFQSGDPWLASYSWQRLHFAQNVMSISPLLKHLFLFASQGIIGMYVWTAMWWLNAALTLGLLTRWRLQAGVALVMYFFFRAIFWTNVVGSEGVLWTLVFFVFITQEEYLQTLVGGRYSFVPWFRRPTASKDVVAKKDLVQPTVKVSTKKSEPEPVQATQATPAQPAKPKEKTNKEKEQEVIDAAPEPIS